MDSILHLTFYNDSFHHILTYKNTQNNIPKTMCHFKDLRTISKKKTYLVKMMSNTIKTFNALNIEDLNINASIPRYSPRN
jgi:hypothetical protein